MFKRLIIPLLFGVLLLLSIVPGAARQAAAMKASAREISIASTHLKPDSLSCTPCFSDVTWTGGTTGGGQTTTWVPNITLTGSDNLLRSFELSNQFSGNDYMIMGVEYNVDLYSACGTTTSTGQWYVLELSRLSQVNYHWCFPVTTRGLYYQFYTNPDSNGKDQDYGIYTSGGTPIHTGVITNVQSNLSQSYTENDENVELTITGTFQGEWSWTYNEYWHNGWNYQQNTGQDSFPSSGAVQSAWEPAPAGASNHGGTLNMCEKDTGNEDSNPGCP